MVKITIENSVSTVCGLTASQYSKARSLMSYKDMSKRIEVTLKNKLTGKPLINSRNGRIRTHFINPSVPLLKRDGSFPTGILYVLVDFLITNDIPYSITDKRVIPKSIETGIFPSLNLPYKPFKEQIEAAEAANSFCRGIIVAPTGTGKSAIVALIIDKLKVDTLIVVPSVDLKSQLLQFLSSVYGKDSVGSLKNGKKIHAITAENIDQLEAADVNNKFDCVIIDEFHRSGSMTYRTLNETRWNGIFYRFGLTATPFRSKEEEKILLESVLADTIYCITYNDAVEKNRIVPMESYYIELPKMKTSATRWDKVYKTLVVEREDRNKIICEIVDNLHNKGIPTIILVKQIAHGNLIQEMLEKNGLFIPFANGEAGNNKELIRQFNSGDITTLIGTTGVIGEGIDTKPCEYVILAGGGKSKNQFMQNIGRGFRVFKDKESCKIVMFKDTSHKWLLDHFNSCVSYLKEEFGQSPTLLSRD